jgi:hypothetical protein
MTLLQATGHVSGGIHALVIDRGQDSVNPAGMQRGLDVYCGYDSGAPGYRRGSFSNMGAIKARFPGKKYLSVGKDCIDIEPGLASPSEAPAFQREWRRENTDKPVYYANGSQMPEVKAYLNSAGIPRSAYYLWIARWNGGGIPAGYDGIQNGSTSGFDSDLFEDYMFTGHGGPVPGPSLPGTVRQGSSGKDVVTLRIRLNIYGAMLQHDADGGTDKFGPLVKQAAEAFQKVNGLSQDGVVGPVTWTALLSSTAKHITTKIPTTIPRFSVSPHPTARTVKINWAAVAGNVDHFNIITNPSVPGHGPVRAGSTLRTADLDLVFSGPVTITVDAVDPSGKVIANAFARV